MMTAESCKDFFTPFANEFINHTRVNSSPVLEDYECTKADVLFAPNENGELYLEKTVHYDIPLFRGDFSDNDKHFESFSDSKYDWERVNRELLHMKQVKKEEPIATEARAFVHPATGLVHPVPLEWEEDLKMDKMRKTQARKRQMAADSQTVLSSMHDE